MRKTGLFVALVCLTFLAWTMSCQSPSSTGKPSSSTVVNDNQSNSSNNNTGTSAGTGFIRLRIKDAPVEDAKNVWVTISEIRFHGTGNDGGNWFTPILEEDLVIDLLALQEPFPPLELPTATLPAGTYNQIRMTVTSGEIVFGLPDPDDSADETFPLNVPSGEIKSHLHFVLEGGETVLVTIDFDAQNSIHIVKKGKNDSYILRPVVNVVEVVEAAGN